MIIARNKKGGGEFMYNKKRLRSLNSGFYMYHTKKYGKGKEFHRGAVRKNII